MDHKVHPLTSICLFFIQAAFCVDLIIVFNLDLRSIGINNGWMHNCQSITQWIMKRNFCISP